MAYGSMAVWQYGSMITIVCYDETQNRLLRLQEMIGLRLLHFRYLLLMLPATGLTRQNSTSYMASQML